MSEPTHDKAHIDAHAHSHHHKHTLMASMACGCFSCYSQFTPDEITEWCDEYQTAHCPKCRKTAVIGDASGHPVHHRGFLEKMHLHWLAKK